MPAQIFQLLNLQPIPFIWASIMGVILGLIFLYWAIALMRSTDIKVAMKTFRYSITYLIAYLIKSIEELILLSTNKINAWLEITGLLWLV